jgi:HD-GYP domain-containing protein (c-di-GMP phosphodiesterase class II)
LGHHRLLPEGYPPLRNNIFFESRVIGLADMYDAMRSPKFYKGPLSHEAAITELEKNYQAGAFDTPLWVAARHTFQEFNHDLVGTRNRQSIAPS